MSPPIPSRQSSELLRDSDIGDMTDKKHERTTSPSSSPRLKLQIKKRKNIDDFAALLETYKNLQSENINLKAQADKTASSNDALTNTKTKLSHAEQRNTQLEKDKQTLIKEAHILKTDIERLQYENTDRFMDINALEKKLNAVKAEYNHMKAEKYALENKNEIRPPAKQTSQPTTMFSQTNAASKVKALEDENKTLKARVESLETEVQKASEKHEAYTTRVKAFADEL
ncbi:hypothetical protein CC86DRAFT_404039 [Ophiobolus disseminans]|uniref:Uncharacterized protein n=1 Tax=Ophiobolus disseminans TaxID=1469910 RepID=A0A6A7A9J0_9PLEO|nr:hypothetical protein CC86DRAFT_404039 [Ophiobolus disseminans]